MGTTDYEIDGDIGTATLEESAQIVESGVALAAFTKAEIDIQISTAKAYPRSITNFKRTCMDLATLDQATAKTMFYSIPREGKRIQGPSIRMAEIVAYAWGNVRAMARIVAIDERMVTAQGICFDLERNISSSVEVKRSIVKSDGKTRYSDDMIRVTCQAACSIAYREAVFKVVPRSLFKDIYEKAQLAAVGKWETTEQAREEWLKLFESKGVKRAVVCKKLGVRGENDLTTDHLIELAGIDNAINDGEITIEEAFADDNAPAAAKTTPLNERVRQGNGGKKPQPGLL